MALPRMLTAAALATALGSGAAAEAPPSALQVAVWAASCMACHGTDGRAGSTGLTIAGQPREALLTALRQFSRGERPATIMDRHAKGYSDTELAALADYFAARPAR